MSIVIRDGTGAEFTAKVTNKNELVTKTTSDSTLAKMVESSKAFLISSGVVSLTTTGSFNGMLYIKNTSTFPLHLWSVRFQASVASQWQAKLNPTAGTLISEASAATTTNLDTKSTLSLTASKYKAAGNGKTVTDGTVIYNTIGNIGILDGMPPGFIILGVGHSLSFSCKPTASGDASADLICFLEG